MEGGEDESLPRFFHGAGADVPGWCIGALVQCASACTSGRMRLSGPPGMAGRAGTLVAISLSNNSAPARPANGGHACRHQEKADAGLSPETDNGVRYHAANTARQRAFFLRGDAFASISGEGT